MQENFFRRKVSCFQFICCLLVIWNHAGNAQLFLGQMDQGHPLWRFEYGTMLEIVQYSIPCFLMLSGYLFCRNFRWEALPGKWKRRVKSLLIPYLLWNLLYYFAYLTASWIPGLDSIVNRSRVEFSITDMFNAAVFYVANPLFWFMFQLILLTALAPVLYLVLREIKSGLLFLLVLAIGILNGIVLPFLNLDALVYYSLAVFFALHGREFVEAEWSVKRAILGMVFVIAGILASNMYFTYAFIPAVVFSRSVVPMGIWLLFPETWTPDRKPWMECTFFVYAFHFVPVRFINKIASGLFYGNSMAAAVLFIVMPLLAFSVCYLAAIILRRFASPLWEILNGGR